MLMTIYSISRIDDISWGTKGRDSDEISKEEESKKNLWRKLKMLFAGKFLLWNYFFSLLIIYISDGEKVSKYFLIFLILIILLVSLLLKVILGVIYLLRYKVTNCSCCSTQMKNVKQSDKISFLFRKLIGSIEKNIEKKIK
jgi:cellulose synthase/poly-beta-1,6-N-acetylglucosamine synthase-like glycosyltransferase